MTTSTSTSASTSAWERDGQIVAAMYLGDYLVEGRVVSSRVKYGAKVQHTISLIKPFKMVYGEFRGVGDTLLIDEEEIISDSVLLF